MFKHIQIFRINHPWSATIESVEAALDAARYVECGASQERSVGWIEPRGEKNGPLVESVDGQWIMKLMVEIKSVPGSTVKEKTDQRALEIFNTTGRKPGKRERKQISEDVRISLLPMAFSKKYAATVWIDRAASRLVVEASSSSKADEVVSALVKSLDGFAVAVVQTNEDPAAVMTSWLDTQEAPTGFTIDRDCKLKANDESKASVRYTKHALDIEEIKAHIAMGKTPEHLAMTWNSHVSFMLTEQGHIKALKFLDVVFEKASGDGAQSEFDADVTISTGELKKLIPDLHEALGGVATATSAEPLAA